MSSKLLVGFATGVLVGMLFAPDKGSETRKKITEKGTDLKSRFNDFIDSLSSKADDMADDLSAEANGFASKAKQSFS
jgi:gas vesicle protein